MAVQRVVYRMGLDTHRAFAEFADHGRPAGGVCPFAPGVAGAGAGGVPGAPGMGTSDRGCCAARAESALARIAMPRSVARSRPARFKDASYLSSSAVASGTGIGTS